MDKATAIDLLAKEISLYDEKDNVLYMPDVSTYPYRFHGIQEFHPTVSKEEMKSIGETITEFCTGYIPAPGAFGGNENGYATFTGFETPDEERDETENEIKEELTWYVDRLEEKNILSRLDSDTPF